MLAYIQITWFSFRLYSRNVSKTTLPILKIKQLIQIPRKVSRKLGNYYIKGNFRYYNDFIIDHIDNDRS